MDHDVLSIGASDQVATSDGLRDHYAAVIALPRLREVLRDLLSTDRPITLDTPLRQLTSRPARVVLKEISDHFGLVELKPAIGWLGVFGVIYIVLGAMTGVLSVEFHRPLFGLVMVPIGAALMLLDPGKLGALTVGDLAERLAQKEIEALIAGPRRRPDRNSRLHVGSGWGSIQSNIP
jgi:hypothetical protein